MVGGISSTTTNVQHPPDLDDDCSHIAPKRPPHTSLLVERTSVMKPISIWA